MLSNQVDTLKELTSQLDIIREAVDAGEEYTNVSLSQELERMTRIPVRSNLVDSITQDMRKQEVLKYPDPPYKAFTRQLQLNNEKKVVTYVRYDGSTPTSGQLKVMRAQALILRKLSILGGIANALQFSREYMTASLSQREQIEALLEKFRQKAKKEAKILDDFMDELIKGIENITGDSESEVIRQIRNSERYFVAEYNRNHLVINEMPGEKGTVIQVDERFKNALTENQKQEFMKIHNPDPSERPTWFTRLPRWEQEWFYKVALVPRPDDKNPDWAPFMDVFKSSAMPHIPGINNARQNYLLQRDKDGNYKLLSRSFKIGTMVPYEMHQYGRNVHTEANAEQVLDRLAQQAETNFNEVWKGLDLKVKPMVFVSGLLSDTLGGGSDSKLMLEQKQAVNKSKKKYAGSAHIVCGNDPVNILRYIASESGILSRAIGRWDHTHEIMDSAFKLWQQLNRQATSLTDEQKLRMALIKEANAQLYQMRENYHFPRLYRNFGAFKTAYTDILVEAMGGMVSTNCKSGKDRTGLNEIYRHALLLYFQKYGRLPSYTESREEHKKFIAIFIPLYNSMKAQEAAASNTPGSFGLKDDAMMLCRDIKIALDESYTSTSESANDNKYKKAKEDEAMEGAETRIESAKLEKQESLRESHLQGVNDQMYAEVASLRHTLDIQKQKITDLKLSLKEYIALPDAANKKNAIEFLDAALPRLEKKLQKVEAAFSVNDVETQTTAINDLRKNYNDMIKRYKRNRIKRFFSAILRRRSRYDEIIKNGKLKPGAGAKPQKLKAVEGGSVREYIVRLTDRKNTRAR